MVWTSQIPDRPFSYLCKNLRDFTYAKLLACANSLLGVFIPPLKLLAVCVGRDVGRCRIEGQVLVTVGFFTSQLEAFFSPRNVRFFFSYCFALLVSWMFWPAAKVLNNCGALSYNLSHHERKRQVQGHLVGTRNCRLPVRQNWCSWCKTWTDEYRHEGWRLQEPRPPRARDLQQKEFNMLPFASACRSM